MFMGHFASAFAAKAIDRRGPLAGYFVAAMALDYLYLGAAALGLEHTRIVPGFTASNDMDSYDMRFTHSLPGAAIAAVVLGLIAAVVARKRAPLLCGALFGAAVFSHFVLDWVVHVPELPLSFSGSPKVGLGLWNDPWAAFVVELALFGATAAWVARGHRPARALGLLVAALLVVHVGNYAGLNPPTVLATQLSLFGITTAFVVGAALVDRHAARAAPR